MISNSPKSICGIFRYIAKPQNKIPYFLLTFLLINTVSYQVATASDYKIDIEDINFSQSDNPVNQYENTPVVLPSSIEKVLGFSLNSEITSVKINKNKPLESMRSISIITGKNQKYFLYLSASNKKPNSSTNTDFPQFLGDSGDCQSLFHSCSWVVNSTYGLGYRIENPPLPDFSNSHYFKRFPFEENNDDPSLLLDNLTHDYDNFKISYKLNLPGSLVFEKPYLSLNYLLLPTF